MDLSPRTLFHSAQNGRKRTRRFRAARYMFIRAFTGQYYDQDHGDIGDEPMNLSFSAIRAIVPAIVTRFPKTVISTDYLAYRKYAELLALGMNYLSKRIELPKTLQRGLVDSIFMLGIFKTGLITSDRLCYFGDEGIDPGEISVDTVDFDNFTFDPAAKRFDQATFLGETIRVEREKVLGSGMYDNALIEKMPSSADMMQQKKNAKNLSSGSLSQYERDRLHNYIDLMELWIRDANMLVTLSSSDSSSSPRFLRQEDYNGPKNGPYTFLSLTPPVPDNPLPVSMAGIWHDLHNIGNRIVKKTMDQADAQKDVLVVEKTNLDEGNDIAEAQNLEIVAGDPAAVNKISLGGQNPQNEQFIAEVMGWFNQMSGNTNLLGGQSANTKVATVANILNTNSSYGVAYMRDAVYDAATDVLRKCAWYLHTDPLISLPLISRETIPAQYDFGPQGEILMVQPAQVQEQQVFLTPEARRGEFLDFAFEIEQDSMAPLTFERKLNSLEILAVRIIPAAAQAAQLAMQMGQPFSFKAFVGRAAKLLGIEWIDEIFQDPEMLQQMMLMAQRGPQMEPSKGTLTPAATGQQGGAVVAQNSPPRQTQAAQLAQSAGQMGGAPVTAGNTQIFGE